MTEKPSIAVVGAGLIGRRHIEHVKTCARLCAIVDPSDAAKELAASEGVPWFSEVEECLASARPDGAVIATPNQLHVAHGLACIKAGVPALIEKPIADSVIGAMTLNKASIKSGVPILVGHHRRHNPLIRAAKAAIDDGQLGKIVAVNAQFWLYKPDDYFEQDWRRKAGAGPVFINLIHDVDLIRHLCGEIIAVQATESSIVRGFEVEDTAGVLLTFQNGAIGTISITDSAPSPWSWELTSGENAAYPKTEAHAYSIAGTRGSLSVPDLKLWSQPEKRSWWEPIAAQTLEFGAADPLICQMEHFCDVIAGRATPLVSAEEGLRTLRVIEAIKEAAGSGQKLRL